LNICVYGASSALLKNIYYEKQKSLEEQWEKEVMVWCLEAELPE
jgi:hypothetical protein